MCGRFGFKGTADDFAKVFGYQPRPEQLANYNVAPTTSILYGDKDGHGEAQWGLVWKGAKDQKWAPINARAETLESTFPFKLVLKAGKTCIIPASLFYEWQKLDASGKKKQPYLIGVKDEPFFAFAGLWDRNETLGITSCTIITTEPNELMAPIHNRMPVILPKDAWSDWLRNADKRVLVPYDPKQMYAYKIGPGVGNVKNKGPEIKMPLTEAADFEPAPKTKRKKKASDTQQSDLF